MAWLEMHQTMPRHRKTLLLAKYLNTDRRQAVGVLVDLWCWALDNADKTGLLSDMDAGDVSEALGFTRKRGEWLMNALVQSGYMEPDGDRYRLHDWYEYAGRLMDSRDKRRLRNRRYQEKINSSDGDATEF